MTGIDAWAAGWRCSYVLARAEWRVRWRSHLLVAVLVATTVAVTVAALSSAVRSEEALDRLRAATRAGDAVMWIEDTQRDPAGAVAAVKRVDGVVAAGAAAEVFVRPAGTEYFPDFDLYPTAPVAGDRVDTPVITSGRPVRPDRVDEVALSEDLADELGLRVGGTLALESMTSAWIESTFSGGDPGPPDGPLLEVEVVGIGRTPADFGRFAGVLWLSPSFVERYEDQMQMYVTVHTRLTPHAMDQGRAGRLPGVDGAEVSESPFGDISGVDDGLGAIATALRLVVIAAVLAGTAAAAFALVRSIRQMLGERTTLGALGWTRRGMVLATVLTLVPWLIVGVGVGVITGVIASPGAMIGLARRIDPAPRSVVVDPVVVLVAGVVALAVALMIVVLAARRAATHQRSPARPGRRGMPLMRPLPAVLGIRHALFAGSENGGRLSRGALAALAGGMVVVVAALVVSASIARLETDPDLTGQGAGRVIDSGESVDVYDRVLPLLEGDDRVGALTGVHISFAISPTANDEDLTTLVHDIRRGDPSPSMVAGRIARGADEVALGPATLDRLDHEVGDVIELRGAQGTAEYHIVGSILFPEGDFDHDDGAALSVAGADRLLGNAHDGTQLHMVSFDWAEGVDTASAERDLAAAGFDVLTNDTALQPAAVTNLGEVQELPVYLALFVGLLALVTLGHALSVTMRVRAREFATLRALGATARASSATIAAQAATLLVVAIAIGLPAGLATGRHIWTLMADRAHVVVLPVSQWGPIAIALAAATVATAALTAITAWRARRLRTVDVLRAE